MDKIATPHVKKYLEAMTFKSLNDYPTPKDYAEILDSCEVLLAAQITPALSDRVVALPCQSCLASAALSLRPSAGQ